jgi:hypothetical protein
MCYWNLTHAADKMSPQTRAYLKERLYWNAAVYLKPGDLDEYPFDFGPIDESALGDLSGIKDCSTSQEVYEHAIQKHDQKEKKD